MESNIKYLPEYNQYYIKIDDIEIRGNIGTIYDKKILQNDKILAHQVVKCIHKNNCTNILQETYCKFYHDPQDLEKLKNNKIISDKFYQTTIKYTRNFANTSWMYDSSTNNNYMRKIGSSHSLNYDINKLKINKQYFSQIEDLKQQIMHDLLVLKKLTL